MSTPEAASLTVGILLFALGLLVIGLCRTAGRVSRAEEQRVWDNAAGQWIQLPPDAAPGPGQLTVDQVTGADPLELLYLAPVAEQAARLDRLRQAIRDEQKEDQ
jgi:hypothetical protein